MFSEDFEVSFVDGDLLDFVGDAIVVNTNIRLNLNYKLGKAVLEKAGEALDKELQRIFHERFSGKDLPLGTAVSANAYGMSDHVQKIIFVSWWNQDNEYSVNHNRVADLASGPSRPGCRCMKTVDIGMDTTCPGGCFYCYVTTSTERAIRNYETHDPMAKMMK